MRIKPFGKVRLSEIQSYLNAIGFRLPDIYSYFLTQTNGGVIEGDSLSFSIPNMDTVIYIEKFYGFGVTKDEDIVEVNNTYGNDLPPNSLIIGYGCGGFFVLVNDDNDSLLYFWDEELNLDISNSSSNAYLLSDSFSAYWKTLGEIYILEGDNNMDRIPYVPLGSIILLNGSYEKVIIVGRGLIVKNGAGNNVIFDYAGVTYPEGLVGDHVAYFNHIDVAKVVFEGFSDEADTITVDNINKYITDHPEIERGSVDNWD